jgi:crotonobetainyl-CoA:carnitine CoA-transferase CaiB-like acyl-CoA transferase
LIDLSQREVTALLLGEALVDYALTGRVAQPLGNRHPLRVPQGVYPCQGEDMWLAISVGSDAEWHGLCRAIGQPALAQDPRFATFLARRAHQEELDHLLTAWTQAHEHYEAMHLLQAAGVPAGPALDIARVYHDPQLRAGGYLTSLQTSDGETRQLPGLPWRCEGLEPPRITAAPLLGQHNAYVYHELLGLSETEMARLVEAQVIY